MSVTSDIFFSLVVSSGLFSISVLRYSVLIEKLRYSKVNRSGDSCHGKDIYSHFPRGGVMPSHGDRLGNYQGQHEAEGRRGVGGKRDVSRGLYWGFTGNNRRGRVSRLRIG